ncbi:endolytic transglycosylase MltG [Collinsella intestinalis]|uniref:endolytic transglycosylase MltG n=1 Tax=Collinsella intestinalis TaxID=147207 RepID=UPI00315D6193
MPTENKPSPRTGRAATSRSQATRPTGTRFKTPAASGPARHAAKTSAGTRGHHIPHGAHGHVQPVYTRRSAQPARRSHVPVIAAIICAVAVLVLFIVVGLPAITGLFTSGSADQTVEAGVEVEVNIPQGATGDQIASILSENNIIPDPQDYYAEVKAQNADMSLKPGDYRFTTLQDPADVVAQLVAGPNVQGVTLTIVEGLTVEQTAQRVEEVYGIAADDFMVQAKASNYAADYDFLADVADDSLEGFLYPKTYSFAGTPTADDIIRAMLDQYQVEVASLDFDGARATIKSRYGVELSDYDLLTMASVIEREALTEDQRYNVSSTFYNRLEAGMPLQSDATMMYVTGGAVTSEDLKRESPYNTYLNQGLPPTPICSPSLASIKAALAPADTDYLYFFITTDDEYFSETYDQHLAAIEENR